MNLTDARELALQLLAVHGLRGWSFGWNRRKRSLGLCRYADRRIELSLYFVPANSVEPVRETILHEIAHALAGEDAGHGPRWKAVCLRVGCKPERCDNGTAIMPRGGWNAQCPGCGKTYSRHRRPHKHARYWCRQCGPAVGVVVFKRSVLSAGSA
jgi:predicted SprT family Zn-dependent metalloprotease